MNAKAKRSKILALALPVVCLALPAGAAHAGETESVYTELQGETCSVLPGTEDGGGALRCPGAGGHELLVHDEDARVSLSVVSPDGTVHDLDFWHVVTRSFSAFGPRVEWRMKSDGGGDEVASFIVPVDAYEAADDPQKVTSYRVVVKIDDEGICATHRIAPGSSQEVLAREFADDAAGSECLPAVPDSAEIARRIAWLRDAGIPIKTLAPHADTADLRPLMDSIGSARVVQLGEANHGDGATMEAKVRLIHFLHQEMGFDVLAWESGFFDCREMDAGLRGSEPVADVASRCLYGVWPRSAEIEAFLEEVRATWQTPRPLRIVGFDSKMSTHSGRQERFPRFVFGFFDRLDPALISAQEREDLTAMSAGLVSQRYFENPGSRPFNRELPRRLVATLEERGEELRRIYSPAEIDWTRQALVSLIHQDRILEEGQGRGPAADGFSRDTAMAQNLLWWLRGPLAGQKVIVWAHNFHVEEGLRGGTDPSMPMLGPAGHHLHKALGEELYTIGFLSHSGAHGMPGSEPVPLPEPVPDSMDAMLHATGHPLLFLDLLHRPADPWLRGSWYAGFYFYIPLLFHWTSSYDAIFYVDVQHPPTLISALQSAAP